MHVLTAMTVLLWISAFAQGCRYEDGLYVGSIATALYLTEF